MKWLSILVLAIAVAASLAAAVRFATGTFDDYFPPILGVKRGEVSFGLPLASVHRRRSTTADLSTLTVAPRANVQRDPVRYRECQPTLG